MHNPTQPDNQRETSRWQPVKELMGEHHVALGRMTSFQFRKSPRRVLFSNSYFKFAAKMIGGPGKRVLDVGCGEGLGTWMLAKECGVAHGLDIDADSVAAAQSNWKGPNISFACADFLDTPPLVYDGAVSLDVIEHIRPDHARAFLDRIAENLAPYGVAVLGTPNITSDQYASPVTRVGHINLYSGDRLEQEMRQVFKHVFMFGANDEVIHTGFFPMCHYLIAVGCGKQSLTR